MTSRNRQSEIAWKERQETLEIAQIQMFSRHFQNPFVVKAVESLHSLGKYKLAVVTNNGFWDAQKTKSTFVEPELPMDFLIESCKIGQRKPDAEFYQASWRKKIKN
jgi:FMN phosphatase YigB (HAD superfamily)